MGRLFCLCGKVEIRLARGPAEGAVAEQVDVKMIDGLAAVGAGVDDHAIAVGEAFGTCDFGCGPEEMAEEFFVVGVGFGEGDDVLAGGDEDVDRGLRMDVGEGVALAVLVDGGGGDGAVDDLAEEAGHGVISVQQWRLEMGVIGRRHVGERLQIEMGRNR